MNKGDPSLTEIKEGLFGWEGRRKKRLSDSGRGICSLPYHKPVVFI